MIHTQDNFNFHGLSKIVGQNLVMKSEYQWARPKSSPLLALKGLWTLDCHKAREIVGSMFNSY